MSYYIATDQEGRKWVVDLDDPDGPGTYPLDWLKKDRVPVNDVYQKNQSKEKATPTSNLGELSKEELEARANSPLLKERNITTKGAKNMNFPLDKNDRMVMFQFSFPNDDAVPIGLRSIGVEDNAMATKRKQQKARPTGTDLLGGNFPEKTSLMEVPISLIKNDLVLVNAAYQKRQDQHRKNTTYHMIRFTFVRKRYEQTDDEQLKKFLPFRGLMMAEFQGICELALWRVRLFRNPFFASDKDFQNGIASPNETAISINLEARVPLFERNNAALCALPECQPKFWIRLANGILRIDSAI